ncbi:MAG: heavy-metal-associated domain-containing protein [Butyrivibrio sp.]|nr:heavy-metal-associated domain-containing protein [Acetatifactor muris]MCM1560669.1 heavy-metal-associated domain-containing protein [Butyrivibrio sp.]
MENVVIIVIVIVILAVGIRSTVRHFKGQGGCCGGGSVKIKKKKLSKVLYRKTFQVEGMHCEHCKGRVEEAVNDIKGAAGRVSLKKGELTVSYAADVPDDLIREKVERAGYRLLT